MLLIGPIVEILHAWFRGAAYQHSVFVIFLERMGNLIIPVLAVPIIEPSNPSPEPSEPPWKAEPTGRGSFAILLNCLLTLCICVWTTIHTDFVPNRSWWLEFRTKCVFVISVMLAPEIMLAVAAVEWVNTCEMRGDWCDAGGVTPGSEEDTFGMAGAFLVEMGGLVIW